jgi:flavin-binding protein dodecin
MAPVASGGNMSEQQDHVPGAVVRITEIVGSSPNSFSDAVRNAVRAAAETVRGIRGVEVISSNADVDDNGNLSLYKVNCKIAFVVERSTT